jgi:hypothetical protein
MQVNIQVIANLDTLALEPEGTRSLLLDVPPQEGFMTVGGMRTVYFIRGDDELTLIFSPAQKDFHFAELNLGVRQHFLPMTSHMAGSRVIDGTSLLQKWPGSYSGACLSYFIHYPVGRPVVMFCGELSGSGGQPPDPSLFTVENRAAISKSIGMGTWFHWMAVTYHGYYEED